MYIYICDTRVLMCSLYINLVCWHCFPNVQDICFCLLGPAWQFAHAWEPPAISSRVSWIGDLSARCSGLGCTAGALTRGRKSTVFWLFFFVCKTFNRNKVVPPVISKLAQITPLCFVADISLLIHGGNINQQYHHSSLQLVFNCTMWAPQL